MSQQHTIQTILHQCSKNPYRVSQIAQDQYRAESGDLTANIFLGCFMQYYAFIISVNPQDVNVIADVPCNGWWGGAIGASKNRQETEKVTTAMQNAFNQGQLSCSRVSGDAASSPSNQQGNIAPGSVVVNESILPNGSKKITKRTMNADGSQTVEETIIGNNESSSSPPAPRPNARAVHADTTSFEHSGRYYPKGTPITINGLVSSKAKHLNGKTGRILKFIKDLNRYEIELYEDTENVIRLKPGNITLVQQVEQDQYYTKGTQVLIHGLVSAKQLNGKQGLVLERFDQVKGRYVIKVNDTNEVAQIKPNNLSKMPDISEESIVVD